MIGKYPGKQFAFGQSGITKLPDPIHKLLSESYWHDAKYAYSAGDVIYIGKHADHDAATSDGSWYVWKLTWAAGDLTRKEGPLIGAWDDRTTLGWGV
jgi:hypothetical protein